MLGEEGLEQPSRRGPGHKPGGAHHGQQEGLYHHGAAAPGGKDIAGVDGDGVEKDLPVHELQQEALPEGGLSVLLPGGFAPGHVDRQPEDVSRPHIPQGLGEGGEEVVELVAEQGAHRHDAEKTCDDPQQGVFPPGPAVLTDGVQGQHVVGPRGEAGHQGVGEIGYKNRR